MLFQHSHVNGGCGLTLSEVEPSLYVKVEVNESDEVTGWMIANVWTDDVRHFGTDDVGYPGRVLCTQYRSTGHSTQKCFCAK
jgi:hypothetical protein